MELGQVYMTIYLTKFFVVGGSISHVFHQICGEDEKKITFSL
jgi:hypothetical protein